MHKPYHAQLCMHLFLFQTYWLFINQRRRRKGIKNFLLFLPLFFFIFNTMVLSERSQVHVDSDCHETLYQREERNLLSVSLSSASEQVKTLPPSNRSTVWTFIKKRMAFKPPVTQDPRLLSSLQKGLILACLSLGSSLSGFCSTVYFPAIPEITQELNAPVIGITLVSSLYILFSGIAPIFWASISDYYHIRRFPCLIALLVFTAASIGCALSTNIWMLVVMRCFQSFGGSTLVSVGAGTVADCWEMANRGSAFSFLFVGQFLGPLVGPILSGGLTSAVGWRSAFWVCVGYGVFLFLFLFFFFPETYRQDHLWDMEHKTSMTTLVTSDVESQPQPLQQQKLKIPVKSFNPFKSLAILQYSFVLFAAIEIGVCFGTMFTLETLIPDLYYEHYSFSSWQTGLTFIGAGIGNLLGSFLSGRLSDHFLAKSKESRGGISKAEDRITLNAWYIFFLFSFKITFFL
ncbi:unnamed protein product [Rhizopus stolonifer]